MSRRTLGLTLAGLAALGLGIAVQLATRPNPATSVAKTRTTTDAGLNQLTLPDTGGRLQPLAKWQGKVRVVNFWATWCPPCVAEMPLLQAASRKYAGKEIEFIGIGIDSAANIGNFATIHQISFPLLTGDSRALQLSTDLGNPAQGLPFTAIFAADGRMIFTKLGALDETELAQALSLAAPQAH